MWSQNNNKSQVISYAEIQNVRTCMYMYVYKAHPATTLYCHLLMHIAWHNSPAAQCQIVRRQSWLHWSCLAGGGTAVECAAPHSAYWGGDKRAITLLRSHSYKKYVQVRTHSSCTHPNCVYIPACELYCTLWAVNRCLPGQLKRKSETKHTYHTHSATTSQPHTLIL